MTRDNWRSIVEPAAPQPPRGPLAAGFARARSWAMSLGGHAIALLALSYLIVLQRPARGEDAVVVAPPHKPRQLPEMENPRDLDANKKILDMDQSAEDPVCRTFDEEPNLNETADDEEFQKARGDSLDFLSDRPFKGKGTYDTVGTGGGGHYGGRLGGKRNLVARGGGGDDTERAVLAALMWLARHQNEDGSWSAQKHIDRCGIPDAARFHGRCTPNPGSNFFDPGLTGLAILAFLGAGYTHLSKDVHHGICFGDVVRRGLRWIIADLEKRKPRAGNMYCHNICALALSEAYGMTGSSILREPSQSAVDFTVEAQNPYKGWRYSHRAGDNDTSHVGFGVMVLRSAELSELPFPPQSYDGVRLWIDEVAERDPYKFRVGYVGRGSVNIMPRMHGYSVHDSMTAVGMLALMYMNAGERRAIDAGAHLLLEDPPRWNEKDVDFYYWYYGSLAIHQADGPDGPRWRKWNERLKQALLPHQNGTGCKEGSWEPDDCWAKYAGGGRVYATAINALTLEVYYRYANVFTGSRK